MQDNDGLKIPFLGFEIKKIKPTKEENFKAVVPPTDDDGAGYITASGSHYTHYIDLDNSTKDNKQLILKYRGISQLPEVDGAIDHIVNEIINTSENKSPVELNLDNIKGLSANVKKLIMEEFDYICSLLKVNELLYDQFRSWYIDGRIYHQLLIDRENVSKGIIDIRHIDSVNIKKVKEIKYKRDPVTGSKVVEKVDEYFIYDPRGGNDPKSQSISDTGRQGVRLSKDSVSYVTSGLLDTGKKRVISYLQKALKPANMLRMMEDALVIYRLARAPERRIFYIDTGNLNAKKAEEYIQKIMAKYRNRLVYDPTSGELKDDRKHMSMLEDFWLPRREGGKGTEIDTLSGGQNLGEIEDIIYFRTKLYKSLNVPPGRFEQETGFNIGRSSEISREEINFQKFIDRLRRRFSKLFLGILKVQLLIKNIITEEDWKKWENEIIVDFLKDNHFTELKNSEILRERITTLDQISGYIGEYFSRSWVMKNVLLFTDDEIKQMKKEVEEENTTEDGEVENDNPYMDVVDDIPPEPLPGAGKKPQ